MSMVAGALGAFLVLLVISRNPGLLGVNLPIAPAASTTGERPATSEEAAVISVVERATPAVVSIVVSKDVPVIEQYFENTPNSPFEDFFGNNFFRPFQFQVPQLRERGTERREIGGGSGFVVSSDGLIVTNRHVVSDTNAEYTVFMNDEKQYSASVIARDPSNDIAVIKIDATGLSPLEFGDSDRLNVGQTAIAIGNALSEFQNTVSVGVISGLSRSITAGDQLGQAEQLEQVLQTDAAINPGNSGGPLLNLAGQVVGVNVAVALGSENIGFALPANAVKTVVASVKETGRIVRPFLGVRYVVITPQVQQSEALPVDHGVLVSQGETAEDVAVVSGSPAERAGIQENDIILEIDGQPLDEDTSLTSVIRNKTVGDTVQLKILRGGQERTVEVTLSEVPQL